MQSTLHTAAAMRARLAYLAMRNGAERLHGQVLDAHETFTEDIRKAIRQIEGR
jgi:hypothetical protein